MRFIATCVKGVDRILMFRGRLSDFIQHSWNPDICTLIVEMNGVHFAADIRVLSSIFDRCLSKRSF